MVTNPSWLANRTINLALVKYLAYNGLNTIFFCIILAKENLVKQAL